MTVESWVVDCSAVAAFLLEEVRGSEIDSLVLRAGRGEATLLVPALFWYELLNVLIMAERRGRVSRAQAVRLRTETGHLPVQTETEIGVVEKRRIHEFALAHHLSAYDASYLELAERRGASLRTMDPDLLALRSVYPWIR